MNTSRILIIDNKPIVRKGLIHSLSEYSELDITGECDDINRAYGMVANLKPDIIILDITIGNIDTFHFIKSIKKDYSKLKIIVLSMQDKMFYIEKAFKNGADGYILKSESIDAIISAIRTIKKDEIYIKDDLKNRLLNSLLKKPNKNGSGLPSLLSDREFQVFKLISRGFGMDEVSQELNISVKTANNHRDNIKQKLNINNSRELVKYAILWNNEKKKY